MRTFLLFSLGMFSLTSSAFATILPCANVTLDNYLASNFSCTVGDKTFSNFTYSSVATGADENPIAATGVLVNTLGPLGIGNVLNTDIGLSFQASWAATGNQTLDSVIGFTVTVAGGSGMLIKDTGLAQISGVGVSGSGSASVTEKGCAGAYGTCTPGAYAVMTFETGAVHNQTVANTTFAPIGQITVVKDIDVIGGNGFATMTYVYDTFSQTAVPEPMTYTTLGAGLIALGLLRRRISRS